MKISMELPMKVDVSVPNTQKDSKKLHESANGKVDSVREKMHESMPGQFSHVLFSHVLFLQGK